MLIDGRELAQRILDDLKNRVEKLQEQKEIIPHLAIIRVGDDPATTSYVNQKERMGKKIGAIVSVYNCPAIVTEEEILKSIKFLQHKGDVHGLIVQLPLPNHINTETITTAVDDSKDVDGFKPNSKFVEPIAAAVIRILNEVYILEEPKGETIADTNFLHWLKSQKIVVLGKGKTGGKPIINLLKKMNLEPHIVDSKTQNRDNIIRCADILICAVGNKGTIIHEGMIKKDVILIGIGMSLGADGKLHGDYDIEEIKEKAAYYTPIPGGVGPVNAAMLLVNVVEAAENKVS